jgi:hypothetical protein
MPFESIEFVGKPAPGSCPADGVRITARKMGRKGGGVSRYIALAIGPELARKLSLHAPEHRVRLLFGSGPDAGKIMISVDNAGGRFAAKRTKPGGYWVTINEQTAEGLFALEFPPHSVRAVEAVRPVNGQPPHAVFKASAAMLAVDDE